MRTRRKKEYEKNENENKKKRKKNLVTNCKVTNLLSRINKRCHFRKVHSNRFSCVFERSSLTMIKIGS
jgi:hypothetical protein